MKTDDPFRDLLGSLDGLAQQLAKEIDDFIEKEVDKLADQLSFLQKKAENQLSAYKKTIDGITTQVQKTIGKFL